MDTTFEIALDPRWKGVATATSSITGEEINRWAHLPQNPYDLLQKQKLIRLSARRVGGCIHRCMGHDAISALAICTKEIDEAKGTDYHQRFINYMRGYHEKDINGCCAQTDSKGDRLKRPSEQPNPDAYVHVVEKRKDGIVVSGVKMSITQVAYADEMFVLPTRALMEDDSAFAVAFAVPADCEGVHLITRPVWHREKDEPDASPFCRYGVSDSVVVFDNVFVPNERVFMCGEWDFGRRIALLFADSHRHSYSGCKPGVSDILCGTTALAAEANNIQKVGHVREKLSEFAGAAELAFAAGVAAAVYGEKTSSGVFFPNKIFANVGRRMTGELIYHEYNILTEIAGGIAVTLPFEDDFHAPDTKKYLDKFIVRNPKLPSRCFAQDLEVRRKHRGLAHVGLVRDRRRPRWRLSHHGDDRPQPGLQLRSQEETGSLPRGHRPRVRRLGRPGPGAHLRDESRGGSQGTAEKIERESCPAQRSERKRIWLKSFWKNFSL